jgi:MFS family permease
MMAAGLVLSAAGSVWTLYVGHGLLIGLVGNGAIFAPLVIYVTRWFDRRRGSALALISSGQYIAGIVWPSVFERGIALYGWQTTMLAYSAVVIAIIVPLALLCLRPSPEAYATHALSADPRKGAPVLGMPPNLVLALICVAVFFCLGSRRRTARRCCRCCWPAHSSAGSSGGCLSIAWVGCSPSWPDRRVRRWRSVPSC